MAQVVNAYALPSVTVQPGRVTGRVAGAEHVPAAVRPASAGREDESVRPHGGERLSREPGVVRAQLVGEPRQHRHGCGGGGCLQRHSLAVRAELAAHGQDPGLEVDVAPAQPKRLAEPQARVGARCGDGAERVAHPGEELRKLAGAQVARLGQACGAGPVVAVEVRTTFRSTTPCRTP